jgi:hypothetical protein
MADALIETFGDGALRGVWVLRHQRVDVAFIDAADRHYAEQALRHATAVIDGGQATWEDLLLELFRRQNHITIERRLASTQLPARDFLEELRLLWPLEPAP